MNVAVSSVRYPVTVIVRVVLVILFGLVSYTFLNVELTPNIDYPILAVVTTFPGEAVQDVEGEVTDRYEDAIAGVSRKLWTMSFTQPGVSVIVVVYETGTNLELAAAELQRNLDKVVDLPSAVEKPLIAKASYFLNMPAYQFSVAGDLDIVEVSTWVQKVFIPRIESIDGVGSVQTVGDRTREMRVTFDPERLKARRLTVEDVARSIDLANINQSAGYFTGGAREWTVRCIGELQTERDFRNVVISPPGKEVVYLSEVAEIRDHYRRPDSNCRVNGEPAILFSVYTQAGANIIQTIDGIDEELRSLRDEYGPRGIEFNRLFDQSDYIRDAVKSVARALVEAIVLVLIVLLVFLRSWRSVVIVAISIPVSVIGTLVAMYVFGQSINVLSLAGLTLAIGMIVDDSIVILENIFRYHFDEGKSIVEACVQGTREVGMAAFMCTLTTAAVFAPIFLMPPPIGTLFGAVAFVIAASVFVSLLDAFTVVPMLASRWIANSKASSPTRLVTAPRDFLNWFGATASAGLISSLNFFLDRGIRKAILIVVVLMLFVISMRALPGMDFLPVGGTHLVKVSVEAVPGNNLQEITRLMELLADRCRKMNGVNHVISTPSRTVSQNEMYLVCHKVEESGVPTSKIVEDVLTASRDLPFRSVDPRQLPLFGNSMTRSDMVTVIVQGGSLDILRDLGDKIASLGESIRGVVNSRSALTLAEPQLEVRVDRTRAGLLGFTVRDVTDAATGAVGGYLTRTRYDVRGWYYYIRIMGNEKNVVNTDDVKNISLTSPTDPNVQISLDSVATVEAGYGPSQIRHLDSRRQNTIQFKVHGRPISEVHSEIDEKIASGVSFPVGYRIGHFGAVKMLKKMGERVLVILALSLALVYLLLVMQFQSFIRPLSILLSLPLSVAGANLLVGVTNVPLDAFTFLGYIMMVGLGVKNAILLVTYAVQLMEQQGVARNEALVLASKRRMRPIFMTSAAMIIGMLPLALRSGAGSEIYNGLAMAVIGGLSVSGLFTLIFVPVLYTLLDDLKKRFWKVAPIALDDLGPAS